MEIEHLDVLIIGAGLSGISAAHHLQERVPGKSYAILEARDAIGGTWDLFRYPGIRSDSDMHTLGFRFRPWIDEKAIADGPAILSYVNATASDAGIDQKIRFNHRVERAEWSTAEGLWTVHTVRTDTSEPVKFTCSFLFACSGYYNYDEGFSPEFEGSDRFQGPIVHPQHWPEDLDYSGKRVVVIGSGATAVTVVPAMAKAAAHVTMLQRSPTYIVSFPSSDVIANGLRRILPNRVAYAITRWKNVLLTIIVFQVSRRRPGLVKRLVRMAAKHQLPDDYEVDTHFKPNYNPWEQRMCLVPDGDLFKALRSGAVSIVTDHIETFTEDGIKLKSGDELKADVIVTATGLNLQLFGGAELVVDGRPVDTAETMTYKAMMLGGVPNFAFTIGYTNASWTLKADLVSEFVCRLLNHMDERGHTQCVPENTDSSITELPLLDFSSGYVQRVLEHLPKQGSKAPWKLGMNYAQDVLTLRRGDIDDGVMQFSRKQAAAKDAPVAEIAS